MLPKVAFTGFLSRYREPKPEEGFQDITKVDFRVGCTAHQYAKVYASCLPTSSSRVMRSSGQYGLNIGFKKVLTAPDRSG